jgi:flavin reductase (DIM6/NTAB) family NADH-FMN oxidoreductase RutF
MTKVTLGPRPLIYPMPALLVGSNVDGKPDFMTVAWSGIANATPPMITIGLQHHRYTLKGIRQNGTFSANVASVEMEKETDYCGIVSGVNTDKVRDCKFTIFYGKLGTAPLIEQFPVNLECRVIHMLNLGSNTLVIGQIEEVHVTESCLTEGKPDVDKIDPLLWVVHPDAEYREIGKSIGKAFSIGKQVKP